jgi:hypothetical protein
MALNEAVRAVPKLAIVSQKAPLKFCLGLWIMLLERVAVDTLFDPRDKGDVIEFLGA